MDGHAVPSPPNADFLYDGQDLEALADLPRYCRWILDGFGDRLRGRVLEVGAGIGNFAAHYADDVDELVLLEPAGNLFPRLDARFANRSHVTPAQGYVEEWATPERLGTFDAVVLVNVLEHVEDDAAMLRTLYSLLKPGGSLLLFVPALQWLYGTLDAMVDHFRRYSHRGLECELLDANFDVDRLKYFDLAGVLPWFVMGRVLRRRRFDAAAALGFDRFVAPLMSRVERHLSLPFGKNLHAVARRPLTDVVPEALPVPPCCVMASTAASGCDPARVRLRCPAGVSDGGAHSRVLDSTKLLPRVRPSGHGRGTCTMADSATKSSTEDAYALKSDESEPTSTPVEDAKKSDGDSGTTALSVPPREETDEEKAIGQGSTMDDVKVAMSHHFEWLKKLREFGEGVFHYFFVGCTTLLGLAILCIVPLVLLACCAALLGLPAYLLHQWFGSTEATGVTAYVTPLTVLVTVFWTGYFVTHGWPRLRDWLEGLFGRCKPALTWMGGMLGRFSDEGDDDADTK